jgi:hypothetical protein
MSGGFAMDGISEQVQRKLEQVFEEATDLAVQTVLAGWDRKTPLHFSKIEEGARRLAGLWSCRIQEWAARELTAETPDSAACPTCGEVCSLELEGRTIQSTDGPVPILEWKGTCTRCRRDFFPSARSDGTGQPRTDAGDGSADRTCSVGDAIQQACSVGAEARRRKLARVQQRTLKNHENTFRKLAK